MFALHLMRNIGGVISCCIRTNTIFALSSGSLPSAIAIIRVSGELIDSSYIAFPFDVRLSLSEESRRCLQRLTKRQKFKARYMFYSSLFDVEGELIDRAMAVFLPGPSTFTGEDTAEIYVHGSRAVVNCVCETLNHFENVRPAKAGEFTKRFVSMLKFA
uniref:GTP-binding protein TrmE N-terminal domain-containing protein n=1 Tax=Parascaris equorum TaxID=6256 RepID=A0A914S3E7_PAREQ